MNKQSSQTIDIQVRNFIGNTSNNLDDYEGTREQQKKARNYQKKLLKFYLKGYDVVRINLSNGRTRVEQLATRITKTIKVKN